MENKKEQMEKAKVKISQIIKEFDWKKDKEMIYADLFLFISTFFMVDFANWLTQNPGEPEPYANPDTGTGLMWLMSVFFGLLTAASGVATIDLIKERIINKQNQGR